MSATLSSESIATQLEKQKPLATTIEVATPATPEEEEVDEFETRIPRTVDELIRLRAQQEGNDAGIVSYPDSGTNYVDYTPKQLDQLVERAASYYSKLIPQRVTSDDTVEVVGILGASDLSYLVTFLAVSRLGHSALLLSTRITAEAYESLLRTTKATTLLYHDQFQAAVDEVLTALPGLQTQSICDAAALPTESKLKPAQLDLDRETHNGSFIIHSSGSTGLPKPIFQTHKASLYAYSQYFGLVGHITLPLYHNHGICCLFRAIYSRRKIYIYNANLPLTSQHLLATLREHPDIGILYGVPYALKLLSETEEGIALLAKLDIVMFGGSACPKPIGDTLVDAGVNLVGHYGATEVGQLMTSFRNHPTDKGWDWMRVPAHLKPYLSMEERGPNLYECCVLKGWPSKVATNRDDGSYATKDLFEPHPTLPDAWKYYARLDDTLALENGEKANPLLLEGVIRQNREVGEAVIFGAGKPRLGAFVVPAATSILSDREIIDSVMQAVEQSNGSCPAYARLSREMIRVLPRDTEYRRTDKGTVIRAAFYRDFASAIEAAYVDDAAGSMVLAKDELTAFLHKEFCQRVKVEDTSKVTYNTDLFAMGIDSLQAIQVRSFILKNLKVDASKIARNFVFDFPTINQMADELLRIQHGAPEQKKLSVEERMAAMIDRYSSFEQHQPIANSTPGKYVVVTGATGSLGAHVVASLASQQSVAKVYCLVRGSSMKVAASRVRHSLRERCVYHTLSLKARSKIVALPSSFGDATLGLDRAQYGEVARNLTHVLHFAWSVNFNKGLESFEADCVAGARNLINLCLKAGRPRPASFNFCSSVSATVRTPGDIVPETLPASLDCAQGMGYAQSKLVTEHICDRAAKQTGMDARVLRVGQIIGDTRHGIWNDTEAIPMIFQTAKTVGALPALDESPSWLPVDLVASTCIEIACSRAEFGIFNVVNHETFHWTRDLLPLLRSAGLKFEEVSQREWVQRLRTSNPDPVANPPIKLLDFFASKYDNDQPKRTLRYANDAAQGYSPSLQNADLINLALAKKIIGDLSRRWNIGPGDKQPTAVFVCGPCGSGKSTLAEALSKSLSIPLIEGDTMHSISARESMGSGTALTDGDRMGWLQHIRGAVMGRLVLEKLPAVLVTCSALKQCYRDELRQLQEIAGVKTLFVMLATDRKDELKSRLESRQGHYMGADMVDVQVDTLEGCREDEVDVVPVDAGQSAEEVLEQVVSLVSDELRLS